MKVKIFNDIGNRSALESAINHWLQNKNIKILHTNMTDCDNKCLSVLIFYEEIKNGTN